MKGGNQFRWTLPLSVPLLMAILGAALISGPRRTEVFALAASQEDDPTDGNSSRGPHSTNGAAAVAGDDEAEEEALRPGQHNGERSLPNADEWLNNLRNVPEATKLAVGDLEAAGLRVFLADWGETDESEDQEKQNEQRREARCPHVRVTIRMTDAAARRGAFRLGFTREALRDLLSSLPGVDAIDFEGTNVTDDHIQKLAGIKSLVELHLNNTPITDEGLSHLAGLRELEWLSLENTAIGDAGLAHLRSMKKLGTLYVGRTRVTDAGLKNLEEMDALEELDLSYTNISDAGLARLRDLPLQYLWLDGTQITDAGLVHFKQGMKELFSLDLWETKVTKTGLEQLRPVTHLWGRIRPDGFYGGISAGSTIASNPGAIEPATPEQIARLKEVMWWLPTDTECICVAHGPFALSLSRQDEFSDLDNTVDRFEREIRASIRGLDVDISALDSLPVALVVKGTRCTRVGAVFPFGERAFEGFHIVVFERPLGETGESFMAAIAKVASKAERIGNTSVARVDADIRHTHCTSFIARPAPDVLLFGENRDYLAEVLARMATTAARRALDDDLPEWKHLDLSARQWAFRHFKNPDSPCTGIVYTAEPGNVAKLICLPRVQNAMAIDHWWLKTGDVRALIEISVSVRERRAFDEFFENLFRSLWYTPSDDN